MKIPKLIVSAMGLALFMLVVDRAVADEQSDNIPPGTGVPPIQRDAGQIVFKLQAQIDGRSQLVLDDHSAQWKHFEFSAPGNALCGRGIFYPTVIRGISWYPVWPIGRTCERSFCDCDSEVWHGVMPAVPNTLMGASLEILGARGPCMIVEEPTRANGFRVVVEFNDNDFEGAAWYEVDLVLWFAQQDVFCHSKTNSTGMVADLEMTGSMSISRNDVELYSGQCPVGQWGQFFFGPQPASIPFGDGILCVSPFQPGLIRLPSVVQVDAAGGAEHELDFNAVGSRAGIQPGQMWYFQFWFRDHKPRGAGYNLSDGLMALFTP
jgi:hypothetical protein